MNNGTPKSRELRLRVHSASLETSRTSPRCLEVLEVLLSDTAPTPTPVCAMGRQLPPPLPLLGLTPYWKPGGGSDPAELSSLRAGPVSPEASVGLGPRPYLGPSHAPRHAAPPWPLPAWVSCQPSEQPPRAGAGSWRDAALGAQRGRDKEPAPLGATKGESGPYSLNLGRLVLHSPIRSLQPRSRGGLCSCTTRGEGHRPGIWSPRVPFK